MCNAKIISFVYARLHKYTYTYTAISRRTCEKTIVAKNKKNMFNILESQLAYLLSKLNSCFV